MYHLKWCVCVCVCVYIYMVCEYTYMMCVYIYVVYIHEYGIWCVCIYIYIFFIFFFFSFMKPYICSLHFHFPLGLLCEELSLVSRSQLAQAHESKLFMFPPNFSFSDDMLVARHWPWWEYLYNRTRETLQIRALFPLENWLTAQHGYI